MLTVQVVPPGAPPGTAAADRAGLVTALVELGLSDLKGVVPRVGDAPVAPGLPQDPIADVWKLELAVRADPALTVGAALCHGDNCETVPDAVAPGTVDPTPAIAELLDDVAASLGRPPTAEVRRTWTQRGTRDDYAARVAGRSANVFYGLAPPPEKVGNRGSDPVARAWFLDPGMPVAGWMAARAEGRENPAIALRRASQARPSSLVLLAGLAGAQPDRRSAAPLYDELLRRAPFDRRFLVAIAANRLAMGNANEASQILDALGPGAGRIPSVARLRVQIADATGVKDLESLLQRWRRADPLDAEPVRRLVHARVATGRYAQARDLLPELRRRGFDTDGLELAVLFALGDREGAASVAQRTGQADLASRLRSEPIDPRATRQARPSRVR